VSTSGLRTGNGSADHGGATVPPDGALRRARFAWQRWRRTRPFWGGLLVILGAGEILLSEKAPLPLVIHIGLQGLAGYLVPTVMLLCGLLLWFHPVQKTFYSVLAVLLALGSWITSNLGGFFVGLLLGLIGGSLAFAWSTTDDGRPRGKRRRSKPRDGAPYTGLDQIFRGRRSASSAAARGQADPQPAGDETRPGESASFGPEEPLGPRAPAPGRSAPAGSALYAIPAAPLAFALLAVAAQQGAPPGGPILGTAAANRPASATASPSPTLTPTPTSSPSPTASATPTTSPSPTASPTPTSNSPTPTPTPSPTSHPSPRRTPRVRQLRVGGQYAAAASSTLTAASAALTGLSFDGVAKVPTARGTVSMLKFSMESMALSGGAVLTYSADGHSIVTRASSLGFIGHIVLYTTKISGDLDGTAVTFTPLQPPKALGSDITLTNVVTDQPYASADSLDATGLELSEN
jgi:Family of unknown function (DUF6114)